MLFQEAPVRQRAETSCRKMRPVIRDNASGVSSGQFLLPVLLEHVAHGRLALPDVVRLAAEAPARLYGLFPRKGAITVGSDADLECRGWPVLTFSRGRVVMRDEQVVDPPGHGRFVRPA
jgi:dihydroorotase-like cyclic amidohydrolase